MAVVKSLQTGQAQITGSTVSVTVTSVDTAKSILFFNLKTDGDSAIRAECRGVLTNATTLDFTRGGSTTPTIEIRWTLIEFESGITVQRGATTLTGSSTTETLTSVDTSKSWPLISTSCATDGNYADNIFVRAHISSATELTISRGSSAGTIEVEWQIIEYTACSVQTGTASLTGTSTTASITAVDTAKSLLFFTREWDKGVGLGNTAEDFAIEGKFNSTTELNFERHSSVNTHSIRWYVVEFTDNTSVQSVSDNFDPSTATQKDCSITAIDTARSYVYACGADGYSTGRGPDTSGDDLDSEYLETYFTASNTVRVRRSNGSQQCDFTIFTVEFPSTAGGGGGGGGGGGDTPDPDPVTGLVAGFISLVEIDFDTGTRYYSREGVASPDEFYKPQVQGIGNVERSTDPLGGRFNYSATTIRMKNADKEFSTLKGSENFLGRTVRIKRGNTAIGLAAFTTIFTGEIRDVRFESVLCVFSLASKGMQKLKTKIFGQLNSIDFPDLPTGAAPKLLPIHLGTIASSKSGSLGAVPAHSIDPATTSSKYLYLLARHDMNEVTNVYEDSVLQTITTDYTIATNQTYGQFTGLHIIEMIADPGSAVISANVKGQDSTTFVETPADQVRELLVNYGGFAAGEMDQVQIDATAERQEVRSYKGSLWVGDESKSIEDYLNWYAETFNMSLIISRAGLVSIFQFLSDDLDAPPISATVPEADIRSIKWWSIDRRVSRLQHNYDYHWRDGSFEKAPEPDDAVMETGYGVEIRGIMNQYATEDEATANWAFLDRRVMCREEVMFCELTLPATYSGLELNNWIEVNHWQGPDSSGNGWTDRPIRITRLVENFDASAPFVRITGVALPTDVKPSDLQVFPDNAGQAYAAWYDADQLTGFSDADPVGAVPNTIADDYGLGSSGQGELDQSGSSRPTYETSEWNSLPVLRFDGTDDYLQTGESVIQNSTDILLAVLIELDDTTGTQFIFGETASGATKIAIYTVGTSMRFTVDGGTTYAEGTVAAGTKYIVIGLHSDSGSPKTQLWINNTLQSTTANTNMTGGNNNLYWGARDDGSAPMAGDSPEAFAMGENRASTAHVSLLAKYWSSKYSITI